MNESNKLYEDHPLEDEDKEIQQMLDLAKYFHDKQRQNLGQYRRGQHAKDTGCVQAEFIVHEIPENLRWGVFREPQTYSAILRFSNSSAESVSDKKQARGLAIKLLNIDGPKVLPEKYLTDKNVTAQDFLMVNYPVFAFPNIRVYIRFFQLRKLFGEKLGRLIFAIRYPKLGKIGKAIQEASVTNPLDIQYWSMSPYRLGSKAMKFTAKPRTKTADTALEQEQENYLFDALARRVAQADVYFDFMVQIQPNSDPDWIEDASKEWRSEFIPVATIRIPQNDLYSPEMKAFRESCEGMSFNPWHALEEHKPLGGINRLRQAIYLSSAGRRLQAKEHEQTSA